MTEPIAKHPILHSPTVGISRQKSALYEAMLISVKQHPDFDSVFSKYRAVQDGQSWKVQRRGMLGLWRTVSGSVCVRAFEGVGDGKSAADARCALIRHVCDDIEKIDAKKQ